MRMPANCAMAVRAPKERATAGLDLAAPGEGEVAHGRYGLVRQGRGLADRVGR